MPYARRSPVFYGDCSECGRLFASRRRSTPTYTCGTACKEARRRRLAREKYARAPVESAARVRKLRETRSLEQRSAVAATARRWKQSVGGRAAIPSYQAADQRRRAQKLGAHADVFRNEDVFNRDLWVCGICGAPVDSSLKYPDRMSASLDHIQPLSAGGSHTLDNVRLAHWICNVKRGNRMSEDERRSA